MKPCAKTTIVHIFKELIQHKSIDKITVTEICEIAQNRTLHTWCGGFLDTLNYLKRHSKMILHVYESTYRIEANACFIDISNQLLDGIVDECTANLSVDLLEQDHDFIVRFYRHIFNGLMMDWVNEGMKEEPDDLLKKLKLMINGSVPRSIEAFAEERKLHYAESKH